MTSKGPDRGTIVLFSRKTRTNLIGLVPGNISVQTMYLELLDMTLLTNPMIVFARNRFESKSMLVGNSVKTAGLLVLGCIETRNVVDVPVMTVLHTDHRKIRTTIAEIMVQSRIP